MLYYLQHGMSMSSRTAVVSRWGLVRHQRMHARLWLWMGAQGRALSHTAPHANPCNAMHHVLLL